MGGCSSVRRYMNPYTALVLVASVTCFVVGVAGYAGDWAIVNISAGGAPIVHENDMAAPVIAFIYGGLLK